jgi:hypothetical protein
VLEAAGEDLHRSLHPPPCFDARQLQRRRRRADATGEVHLGAACASGDTRPVRAQRPRLGVSNQFSCV